MLTGTLTALLELTLLKTELVPVIGIALSVGDDLVILNRNAWLGTVVLDSLLDLGDNLSLVLNTLSNASTNSTSNAHLRKGRALLLAFESDVLGLAGLVVRNIFNSLLALLFLLSSLLKDFLLLLDEGVNLDLDNLLLIFELLLAYVVTGQSWVGEGTDVSLSDKGGTGGVSGGLGAPFLELGSDGAAGFGRVGGRSPVTVVLALSSLGNVFANEAINFLVVLNSRLLAGLGDVFVVLDEDSGTGVDTDVVALLGEPLTDSGASLEDLSDLDEEPSSEDTFSVLDDQIPVDFGSDTKSEEVLGDAVLDTALIVAGFDALSELLDGVVAEVVALGDWAVVPFRSLSRRRESTVDVLLSVFHVNLAHLLLDLGDQGIDLGDADLDLRDGLVVLDFRNSGLLNSGKSFVHNNVSSEGFVVELSGGVSKSGVDGLNIG